MIKDQKANTVSTKDWVGTRKLSAYVDVPMSLTVNKLDIDLGLAKPTKSTTDQTDTTQPDIGAK